jgi:sugar lactone lactonase YvrE
MTTLTALVNAEAIDLKASTRFSVNNQESFPTGIAFNNDGTKMFIVGMSGDDVDEYTLSSGFDVSTASFVDSFSVSDEEKMPTGIAFSNDGTKMFIIGTIGDNVYIYNLNTGFDVSTAVFDQAFDVGTEETNPMGIAFNNDGTKMFIVGSQDDAVVEYTLSTGFDLTSTVTHANNDFSIADQEILPLGIAFNNDGTLMFITGEHGKDVNVYSLSSGFDLGSPPVYVNNFSLQGATRDPEGIAFNDDGTKMFIIESAYEYVLEYHLSTEFDLTTIPTEFNSSSAYTLSANLTINSGQKLIINGTGSSFTIDSGVTLTVASGGTLEILRFRDLSISSGGTLLIASGGILTNNGSITGEGSYINNNPVYMSNYYSLPTNFSATTLISFSTNQNPFGLVIDKSYKGNLFCANFTGNTISKITPSGSVSTFVSSGLNGPFGLAFDNNGILFCTNFTGNTISRITPAGLITTFVSSGLSGPFDLEFDKNGNLFCSNYGAHTIVKITPSGSLSTFVSSGIDRPAGLAFDKNGNLFCSNFNDHTILKITPSGTVSTFASITSPQFLAFDKPGNLYTGTNNDKLFRISSSGRVEELIITGAALDDVEGLAFDNKGNLYLANNDNSSIIKIPMGVPSEILVKERFPGQEEEQEVVDIEEELKVFLESLPQEEINNDTLQSLILKYQNSREALLLLEKKFGVSIVS